MLLQRMDGFLYAVRNTGDVSNMGDVTSLDSKLLTLIDSVHPDGDRRNPTEHERCMSLSLGGLVTLPRAIVFNA